MSQQPLSRWVCVIAAMAFLLVGCDNRSRLQRMADDKLACEKVGGSPKVVTTDIGDFVRCEFRK